MSSKTHEQLICVLRQPKELLGVVNIRREPFARPGISDSQSLDRDPYRVEVRPLTSSPLCNSGPLATLAESWESLGAVSRFDAQDLHHVLNILIHTLPDAPTVADVPPLMIEPAPTLPKATAAHPRAFRGTKTQPPKPRQRTSIDLRPHLCVPQDTNRLLVHLAPHLGASRKSLAAEGLLLPDSLPCLVGDQGQAVDVYMSNCHQAGHHSLFALPPLFCRTLLFWLRGMPWSTVGRVLALYWSLDLASDSALLRTISRLLAISPVPAAVDWCELLQHTPPQRRGAFAELVIETGVAWRELSKETAEKILQVDHETPDAYYRHRMFIILRFVAQQGDLDFLMAGFRLANRYAEAFDFHDTEGSADVPVPALETLAEHLDRQSSPQSWSRAILVVWLWQRLPELPGLGELAIDQRWLQLDPDVACEVLSVFANVVYHELHETAKRAKWKVLLASASSILDLIQSLSPEYHGKCERYLHDIAWRWDAPEDLSIALDRYRKLLPRLCKTPFAKETRPDPLGALTVLAAPAWQMLLDAPDAVFLKLERAARRENDARLLDYGLTALSRSEGPRVVKALSQHPSRLFHAAKALGGAARTVQQEIVCAWREHALMGIESERMTTERLVEVIDANRSDIVASCVPKNLRDHLQGTRKMTSGQRQRAHRVLLDNLEGARLDLLYQLTLDRLGRGLAAESLPEDARHAVQLLGYVDDNRRALRTFLIAYFRGNRTYLRHHPRNRAWLAAHPRIGADAWATGIRLDCDLPGGTRGELAIEQNPLEVLRLGTYAGSCLGLGGICAYSAVAVALDINKQVVYCRNSSGAVVARQVLAISDTDQLVCFEIYPNGVGKELKQAFADYDRIFARMLGLSIHDPNTAEGDGPSSEIALLLATHWWNDDAWDLQIDM